LITTAGLKRFRVDPVLFDEQVSAIHLAGFQTIELEDWVGALSRSETLPGKPVIFTFDDGCRDFLSNALSALQKYSLTAAVYLVAGRIGSVADWDLRYGEAAPPMSWGRVR
jgi:peptidoglycan/xylan/chitin deacetylase (PgdA/CDA1 family)